MKVIQSRNKRGGHYAGYYRPHWDYEGKEKRKHHRWDWFSMREFYPPIHGTVWKR